MDRSIFISITYLKLLRSKSIKYEFTTLNTRCSRRIWCVLFCLLGWSSDLETRRIFHQTDVFNGLSSCLNVSSVVRISRNFRSSRSSNSLKSCGVCGEQFVSLDWSNGGQKRQGKKSNNQQRANLAGQIIALLGLLLHSEAKCHFLQRC